MPRAPKPCGIKGCKTIVPNGTRCPLHANGWKQGPRTASSQVTTTWAWQQLTPKVLERDHHQCQIRYPGHCTGRATVVDKIEPASRRPDLAYDPSNHQAACQPCNDHKALTVDKTGSDQRK